MCSAPWHRKRCSSTSFTCASCTDRCGTAASRSCMGRPSGRDRQSCLSSSCSQQCSVWRCIGTGGSTRARGSRDGRPWWSADCFFTACYNSQRPTPKNSQLEVVGRWELEVGSGWELDFWELGVESGATHVHVRHAG